MTTFVGPCQIDCPLSCDVIEGVVLTEMPPSRHAWGDVIRCPNEECDRAREFLVERAAALLENLGGIA